MKENELRTGNLVYDEDLEILPILSINGNGRVFHTPNIFSEIDTLRGIPITMDWLNSIGFGLDEVGFIKINGLPTARWITKKKLLSEELVEQPFLRFNSLVDVYYVHHLQNLYYVLRGEELNI